MLLFNTGQNDNLTLQSWNFSLLIIDDDDMMIKGKGLNILWNY